MTTLSDTRILNSQFAAKPHLLSGVITYDINQDRMKYLLKCKT